MRFMSRVLSSNKVGLCLSPQQLIKEPSSRIKPQLPFCSNHLSTSTSTSTSTTTLIQRLIKEPNSRIKPLLDCQHNSILIKSFDFSWHTFVSALNSSSTPKALQALEWRLEKLLEDKERDQEQYSELIYLCGEMRDFFLAIRVFVSMESIGMKPTSDTFNSLIQVSLSLRNEMTAISLFDIMERSKDHKPNSGTYNAFISTYSKLGNAKAMQAWASAKRAAGFPPDLQSYESLISGFVKVQNVDEADRYYEEMVSFGIMPSSFILDRMVDRICDRQNFSQWNLVRAKDFVLYMLNNRWEISAHIAQRFVSMYSKLGKIKDIEELLQTLIASSQRPEVLSRVHCGIIHMHARADRLDDVENSVGKMLKQGVSFYTAEDVNIIISSFFRRSAYERLELFLKHIKSSYQFSKSTHDLLVDGYHKAGLLEKLDALLKEIS